MESFEAAKVLVPMLAACNPEFVMLTSVPRADKKTLHRERGETLVLCHGNLGNSIGMDFVVKPRL